MDHWTRKHTMIHKVLYPRDDIDRLYVSRKGGRIFTNIEDNIDTLRKRRKDYIKDNKEKG